MGDEEVEVEEEVKKNLQTVCVLKVCVLFVYRFNKITWESIMVVQKYKYLNWTNEYEMSETTTWQTQENNNKTN